MKTLLIFLGLIFSVTVFGQLDTVNIGTGPGNHDGEILYTAFQKVNTAIRKIDTITSPVDTLTVEDSLTVNYITSTGNIQIKSGGHEVLFKLDSLIGELIDLKFRSIITEKIIYDTLIFTGDTIVENIQLNTAMQDIDSVSINPSGIFGYPTYTTNPTATRAGEAYYNSTVDSLRYWDGSVWRNF